jgi:putative transposase
VSRTTSPATGKQYSIALICRVWGVARSSIYFLRAPRGADCPPARRRGPPGPCPDDELVEHIRVVLGDSPFQGEGYRKAWARLRHRGIRTSKERVRRLMREHGLQAPGAPRRQRGNKAHDGRITTDVPDELWGTDATSVVTRTEGTATIFFAVDHCTSECLGIHATSHGDRFEALEPIRQAVRFAFGDCGPQTACGLGLRHDHGSQYTSHHFQDELRFLGIKSTPAYVAEPQCNGVAERFVRTLKEQLLWLRPFDTVEELRLALLAFKDTYNEGWLVQKHNHRTPAQVREDLRPILALVA